MIPKKGLSELLENRLRAFVPQPEMSALMADIDKLDQDWEELDVSHRDMGYSLSTNCPDICYLADQVYHGAVIKLYRKKSSVSH